MEVLRSDTVSQYQSGSLCSVPPALSLLFFQLHHRFSNSLSEVLLKAGTTRMHIPGNRGGQPAAALKTKSPFEVSVLDKTWKGRILLFSYAHASEKTFKSAHIANFFTSPSIWFSRSQHWPCPPALPAFCLAFRNPWLARKISRLALRQEKKKVITF